MPVPLALHCRPPPVCVCVHRLVMNACAKASCICPALTTTYRGLENALLHLLNLQFDKSYLLIQWCADVNNYFSFSRQVRHHKQQHVIGMNTNARCSSGVELTNTAVDLKVTTRV